MQPPSKEEQSQAKDIFGTATSHDCHDDAEDSQSVTVTQPTVQTSRRPSPQSQLVSRFGAQQGEKQVSLKFRVQVSFN
jgi:hypothetical protein